MNEDIGNAILFFTGFVIGILFVLAVWRAIKDKIDW